MFQKVKRRRSKTSSPAFVVRDGNGSDASTSVRSRSSGGVLKLDDGSFRSAASSTAKNSNGGVMNKKKGVKFQNIHVRDYERVIGDNPSCSNGAPVSIGWAYGKERIMKLDDYEEARPLRRLQQDLVLSRQEREEILIEWGATYHEIIESIRANIRAKNQRRRTINSVGTYDRWEEALESASRKLKRTLLLTKPLRKRTEEIQAQAYISSRMHGMHPGPMTYVHTEAVFVSGVTEYGHRDTGYAHLDTMPSASQTPDVPASSVPVGASSSLMTTNTNSTLIEPETGANEELDALGVAENNVNAQRTFARQSMAPIVELNFEAGHESTYISEDGSWFMTASIQQQPETEFDDYDDYLRSQTYWEVEGMDAPGIHRNMMPLVISEDGHYDFHDFDDNGFTLQPPPHSNAIISSWE